MSDEHEYEVSCLIELSGQTPADAVMTFIVVLGDFINGNVEWLEFDTVDRETGERVAVRATPREVQAAIQPTNKARRRNE